MSETTAVPRSMMKPNRNSGLFLKKERVRPDSPKVRAEKDRLIAEFLKTKGVTKCGFGASQWMEPDTALWRS